MHRAPHCTEDAGFIFPECPTSTKDVPPCSKSKIFTLSLHLAHSLLPAFWAPLTFLEATFSQIKGQETLSRSHKDLNTTDDNLV
jgi:hypothetical protein